MRWFSWLTITVFLLFPCRLPAQWKIQINSAEYPPEAQEIGVRGDVVLEFKVNDGKARVVGIVEGKEKPLLVEAAKKSIEKADFYISDIVTEETMRITYHFVLSPVYVNNCYLTRFDKEKIIVDVITWRPTLQHAPNVRVKF